MGPDNLAVARWLTSPEAETWLRWSAASQEPLVAQVRYLRRHLSAAQTHAVLELVELRRRAAGKFSRASQMFFTRQALEQSTSEVIAGWKARRITEMTSSAGKDRVVIADLCCGIGGDLMFLAQAGTVVGIERDPVVAELARANLALVASCGSEIRCEDVRNFDVGACSVWHLDPDRRAQGRRVSQPEFAEPGLETIQSFLQRNPQGAVKLAPAGHVPESWEAQCEREWISEEGECKQQVAWFGRLIRRPGQRCATVLSKHFSPRTLYGQGKSWRVSDRIGQYLYEPDAAVLAAGLAGDLAAEHDAAALGVDVAYFTSDRLTIDAAWSAFHVIDVIPFDRKRLKALLQQRGIGRVEVKKRGVDVDVERLQRDLRTPGEESATVLIAPMAGRVTAILAQRLPATIAQE